MPADAMGDGWWWWWWRWWWRETTTTTTRWQWRWDSSEWLARHAIGCTRGEQASPTQQPASFFLNLKHCCTRPNAPLTITTPPPPQSALFPRASWRPSIRANIQKGTCSPIPSSPQPPRPNCVQIHPCRLGAPGQPAMTGSKQNASSTAEFSASRCLKARRAALLLLRLLFSLFDAAPLFVLRPLNRHRRVPPVPFATVRPFGLNPIALTSRSVHQSSSCPFRPRSD